MALVTAKATGNWSAGSTWDSDPALPAAGDTVDCAAYTVTVDQNVTVAQLKSTGAGYFSVTAARSIAAAVLSDTGSSGTGVVRCTHTTGTVTITGNVTGGLVTGVLNSLAGTLAIVGNVTGGSATNARGAHNNTTGLMTVTGTVIGGSGSLAHGVQNAGLGTVAITGNVTGGTGSSAHGAQNSSTGTLTVDGVCLPGASVNAQALHGANAAGVTTYNRAVIGGALGAPVSGYCKLAVSAGVNYVRTTRSDTSADYDLSNDYPAVGNVRSGTVYQLTTKTGTLTLPAEADVELGVFYGAGGTEYEGLLNAPTTADIATAVLAAMNATPPAVNVVEQAGETLATPQSGYPLVIPVVSTMVLP